MFFFFYIFGFKLIKLSPHTNSLVRIIKFIFRHFFTFNSGSWLYSFFLHEFRHMDWRAKFPVFVLPPALQRHSIKLMKTEHNNMLSLALMRGVASFSRSAFQQHWIDAMIVICVGNRPSNWNRHCIFGPTANEIHILQYAGLRWCWISPSTSQCHETLAIFFHLVGWINNIFKHNAGNFYHHSFLLLYEKH